MRARNRLRVVAIASVALCAASPASARAPELPRDLQGQLAIEVKRCKPIGHEDALLEADVVLRTKDSAVSLPALHCSAYHEDGVAFYPTPVTGRLDLRAREKRKLTVRFAADAAHRECGCTVREPPAPPDAAPAAVAITTATADMPAVSAEADAESVATATLAASSTPAVAFAPPALRYERVLAPDLSLRAAPTPKAAVTGFAPPGARVAVDRIERGWKLARTSDGATGWLPGDAATADIAAPERMAERLVPLHRALAPDASRSEALCASLERSALGELVAAWRVHERAVYVHPLWYALASEDRDAFEVWAADCYSATRVVDAATGREVTREKREARR